MFLTSKKNFVFFVILAFMGVLVYAGSINAPFYLDDDGNILNKESIQFFELSKEGVTRVLKESRLNSRPIANISFALTYYFFGYKVGGFHAVNILIHIFSGIFLFQFLRLTFLTPVIKGKYSDGNWFAFATALIWLVHPVQTQAVTYIVQRMTSMSAMFYILSMMSYASGRISVSSSPRQGLVWFGGSFVAFLLALGSKEIAVTLPAFILLYEWFFFQDLSRVFVRKIFPYFCCTVIVFTVLVYIFYKPDFYDLILRGYEYRDFTLAERLLTESRVIISYISLLLFPHPSRLSLEHDIELSTSILIPLTTFSSIAFLLFIFVAACFFARKYRLYSFVIFWFLGNLLLESSVIPLELFFEHRLYLPSMLFFIFLPVSIDAIIRNKWLAKSLVSLVVILISLWTWQRNIVWADPISFHKNNIKHAKNNYRSYYNLGHYYLSVGKFAEAIGYLKYALELEPNYLMGHKDLGFSYIMTGQYQEALKHYLNILEVFPQDPEIYYYIGLIFREQGEVDKAIMLFSDVIKFAPDHVNAHMNLGNLYAAVGSFDTAIVHFLEVLRITGERDFRALANLGTCYASLHDYKKAIVFYTKALRLKPADDRVRKNLELARKRLDENG